MGLPSIIMQSIGSVMTFGMNKILIAFTETAVSVFGVYFKLQSCRFMPVFGVTNALVPIVGYNYGARSSQRIQQATRLSLLMTTAIMALGTVIFHVAPGPLLSLFSASDTMLSIGIPALRIISVSFCFAGVAIVFSSVFQALGDGMLHRASGERGAPAAAAFALRFCACQARRAGRRVVQLPHCGGLLRNAGSGILPQPVQQKDPSYLERLALGTEASGDSFAQQSYKSG